MDLRTKVFERMLEVSSGNIHDINHFIKVNSFANYIASKEEMDGDIKLLIDIESLIHDIACPICREKYGNTNGKYQELESAPLIRKYFSDILEKTMLERVVYVVSHHHTYVNVNGDDYQTLLEADFIVNADESNYSQEQINDFVRRVFKSKTAIEIIDRKLIKCEK